MEYTGEQKRILAHDPSEHACILAGPGTGKSSIIISYISKIRKQYPDKRIGLLTFTRAANKELIEKVIEVGSETIVSSTIHSFAISVLLNNPGTSGLSEPLRIANTWEWNDIIRKDIAKRLQITTKNVDKLKNEMSAFWESLCPCTDAIISSHIRARFMGIWEEHRRIFGYTLLAELPFRLKMALEANKDLQLKDLEFVAVDEYQDLNACDLNCFRQLADKGIIIFAIGDDDQSIYKFRKAHPAGIRNFPGEYKAIVYPLTVSHRCGKKILEWANFVIEGDTSRAQKISLRPSIKNPDGNVGYLIFNRENNEADGIARLAIWLINNEKVPPEEILILVRTGVIANLIKRSLEEKSIPFADPEGALNILKDCKTRYLLSILQLLANKFDSLAWWTILQLTHGIGHNVVNIFYNLARDHDKQFGEVFILEAENGFPNMLEQRKKLLSCAGDALKTIENVEVPESTQWGAWIIERIKAGELPRPATGMEELLTKIDSERQNDEISLNQYISQIEPIIKDVMNAKIAGRLRIMSLSQSKGLTVKATIIAGVEKEIIPHPRAEDYQEERRLLYVGMTRARDYLFLTRCRRRIGQSARSGQTNIAGTRLSCPFLDGGPVNQFDGETKLNEFCV